MLLLNFTLFELSACAKDAKDETDRAVISTIDVDFKECIILFFLVFEVGLSI